MVSLIAVSAHFVSFLLHFVPSVILGWKLIPCHKKSELTNWSIFKWHHQQTSQSIAEESDCHNTRHRQCDSICDTILKSHASDGATLPPRRYPPWKIFWGPFDWCCTQWWSCAVLAMEWPYISLYSITLLCLGKKQRDCKEDLIKTRGFNHFLVHTPTSTSLLVLLLVAWLGILSNDC